MLGAAGQEGSLFELVQHTRIRIQIQIPEPSIDRNELVQCQAKCRAKKMKKVTRKGWRRQNTSQDDSLRASHKCYTVKMQKKTAG